MPHRTLSTASPHALVRGNAHARDDADRSGWLGSVTVGTASRGGTRFTCGSGRADLAAEELGLSGEAELTAGPMGLQVDDACAMSLTDSGPGEPVAAGS